MTAPNPGASGAREGRSRRRRSPRKCAQMRRRAVGLLAPTVAHNCGALLNPRNPRPPLGRSHAPRPSAAEAHTGAELPDTPAASRTGLPPVRQAGNTDIYTRGSCPHIKRCQKLADRTPDNVRPRYPFARGDLINLPHDLRVIAYRYDDFFQFHLLIYSIISILDILSKKAKSRH